MAFVRVSDDTREVQVRGRTVPGRGGLVEAFGGDGARRPPAAW